MAAVLVTTTLPSDLVLDLDLVGGVRPRPAGVPAPRAGRTLLLLLLLLKAGVGAMSARGRGGPGWRSQGATGDAVGGLLCVEEGKGVLR